MDFLEDPRLIEALLAGQPTDMKVDDAAELSSMCYLTEKSAASRSRLVEVPDFTRGMRKTNPKLPV